MKQDAQVQSGCSAHHSYGYRTCVSRVGERLCDSGDGVWPEFEFLSAGGPELQNHGVPSRGWPIQRIEVQYTLRAVWRSSDQDAADLSEAPQAVVRRRSLECEPSSCQVWDGESRSLRYREPNGLRWGRARREQVVELGHGVGHWDRSRRTGCACGSEIAIEGLLELLAADIQSGTGLNGWRSICQPDQDVLGSRQLRGRLPASLPQSESHAGSLRLLNSQVGKRFAESSVSGEVCHCPC